MTTCDIEWNTVSLGKWDELFATIRRSTLLQHLPYAQAVRANQQRGARHGLIHINGKPAGLVQIGEVGILRNAIHAITMERGPLWFSGVNKGEATAAFFQEFSRQFPRRFARKMRVMPELQQHDEARKALEGFGFKRNVTYRGYQTIWLDLTVDEDELRAGLKGKWRNILSKAERSDLDVTIDRKLNTLDAFMTAHEKDQKQKDYDGPSMKFMMDLIEFMRRRNEVMILNAETNGRTLAAIMILLHGSSATYQIGWTSPEGRKVGAHHKLLWEAIKALKKIDIKDFDLGGVNDESAAGVKKFKLGLGGQQHNLVGIYN